LLLERERERERERESVFERQRDNVGAVHLMLGGAAADGAIGCVASRDVTLVTPLGVTVTPFCVTARFDARDLR
jgi:hypothetical protein